MPRPRRLPRANLLFCSLIILSFVGASLFAASRAEASRQTSGDARASKFAAAARTGKQRPGGDAAQKRERGSALAACVTTPINAGAPVNSELTSDDCVLSDGTRYDVYSYNGTAGQQVSVTLTSADFNAYLYVGIIRGGQLVFLGENDNGGGGTNARLPAGSGFATLPDTGTYYIFPNAVDPADTFGAYTLSVATAGGQCPTTPATIGFGATNGALDASDCRFADNTFYDAYAFNGTAGQQLSITLTAASFDAVVYLLDANRNILGTNNNGGGGTNARLPATSGNITLPATGTYYIVVGAIAPENLNEATPTGAYTLTLADGGPCPSTAITIGQTVGGGTLAATDCKRPNETPFDLYTFSGTAGQQVAVSMSSSAFDPHLALVGPGGTLLAEDDNGGGGTTARIPAGSSFFSLPTTGTYSILAGSLSSSAAGAYTLSLTAAPPPSATLQFSGASFAAAEGGHAVTVTVTRGGLTTNAVSVVYATADGTASERRDYTAAAGRLRFAAGETSKTFEVLITDDRFNDDNETFTVTLSAPSDAVLGTQTSATVTITDNDAADGPSPVKDGSFDPEFFVRQHYADFLNRVPDPAGLTHWIGQTTSCGNPDPLVCRVNVSAAFFLSIEFQQSGYLTHRAYKAAFGNIAGKPVPLTFREFIAGARRIGENVVVGQPNWELTLEANKAAFFDELVATTRFTTAYPTSLTAAQFVDALNANTGGALSTAERNQLVADLTAGTKTRAQVLRAVAEDADFAQSEFRPAFVLAQYFGYLRRNPDDVGFDGQPDPNFVGYNFWLGKLNDFNGDYVAAEMVKGFITSIEYQSRFGL